MGFWDVQLSSSLSCCFLLGLESQLLCFCFRFLLMCTLGGCRCWFKSVSPHPRGRPRETSRLLLQLGQTLSVARILGSAPMDGSYLLYFRLSALQTKWKKKKKKKEMWFWNQYAVIGIIKPLPQDIGVPCPPTFGRNLTGAWQDSNPQTSRSTNSSLRNTIKGSFIKNRDVDGH